MFRGCIRWLDRWAEEFVVSIMLGLLVVLLGSEVFTRFLLGRSFTWMEEMCRYLFIWASYIGIAIAIKRKEQLRVLCLVDILGKRYPRLVQCLYVLSETVFSVFCLLVAYYSIGMLQNMMLFRQISGALEIDMIYPYSIIPLSMLLIVFRTMQGVYRDWRNHTLRYVNEEA